MRFTILFLAFLTSLTPVRAEFVVSSPSSSADPTPPSPAHRAKAKPRPIWRPGPEPVVAGFGAKVPLGFAVRQIVPASIQVAFGKAVDKDALVVDWKGGKPWRLTLSDAVRPLGLTVSLNGRRVTIRGADTSR
jgi:hypothetical protein